RAGHPQTRPRRVEPAGLLARRTVATRRIHGDRHRCAATGPAARNARPEVITMAGEVKRRPKEPTVSVVLPSDAPVLLPSAAFELLALLRDVHHRLVAKREPTRPEAA